MINKIIKTGFLLVWFLLPLSIMADVGDIESMQMACLAQSNENNDQLQNVLENWFITNRREIGDYRNIIAQMESSEGVFSYELVPELIGLGLATQEQSDHSESSDAFLRAFQIVRVNDGLYSTKQLPILDLLIESNSALGKWKQVADNYDMMYWLYRRNYEENDPRQLQALKRLRRWYMESYNKDTGRSLEQLFANSEKLYEQAIRIMWKCTGGNDRQSLCFWHKDCCSNAGTPQSMCPLDRG